MRNPRGNTTRKVVQRRAGDNELGKLLRDAATRGARNADDDVVGQAVLAAYEYQRRNPRATNDDLAQVAERRARNLVSEQRKKQSRVLSEARSGVAVDTRQHAIEWGHRKQRARARHIRLPSNVQRALASELELYERDMRWSIGSGLLLRGSRLRDGSLDRIGPPEERERRRAECASADWHERHSYEWIFACIARHAGLELETDSLVDELVAFRERELVVRCEICGPDSRWTYCKHTLPNFERGKQVSGVSLQGRGRRSLRMNHHARFGTNIDGMPYSNYNSRYLEEAAAGRLVTEALRLAGVDPRVRHVLERQRERDGRRWIQRFLKDWERGPDGKLREKPSHRRRSRSTPGAFAVTRWETVQKQARESMSRSTPGAPAVTRDKMGHESPATGVSAPLRKRRPTSESLARAQATGNWDEVELEEEPTELPGADR